MLKFKSDAKSDEFKKDGNIFHHRNEKYNAIMDFNKSICFAESDKKLSLAYANRSAVFFELKKYNECLLNIQWAKDHGYPADKIQKLQEREEKCKELLKCGMSPEDDPMENIKLSYPAHPTIPFIADCIELKGTDKHDRGIFATTDLKAGDIFGIEEFAFSRLMCSGQYNRCCRCLKVNMMNLIPCLKTASVMFCSIECREKTYKELGDDLEPILIYGGMEVNGDRLLMEFEKAFGGRKNLLKFLKKNDLQKLNKTLFDYDWTDENFAERNKTMCILSFKTYPNLMPLHVVYPPPSFKVSKGSQSYLDLANHFSSILNSNMRYVLYLHYEHSKSMCPQQIHDGGMMLLMIPLIKHSCMANVRISMVENKVIYVVLKPIKKGEQLFSNTIPLPYHKSTIIQRSYLLPFKCDCYACVNNLKPSDFKGKDPHILHEAKENSEIAHKNVKKTKAQLKENHKIITAYANDPLSLEVAELIPEVGRMYSACDCNDISKPLKSVEHVVKNSSS